MCFCFDVSINGDCLEVLEKLIFVLCLIRSRIILIFLLNVVLYNNVRLELLIRFIDVFFFSKVLIEFFVFGVKGSREVCFLSLLILVLVLSKS